MYANFAKVAREEGFDHIAYLFEEVGKIEKEHEERYLKLLENVENGLVFSRDGDMIWQCANCGHIHIGKQAPEVCPVCAHPRHISSSRLKIINLRPAHGSWRGSQGGFIRHNSYPAPCASPI